MTEIEIFDLKKTAHHYLVGWFLIDVCSSVPFALISGPPSPDAVDSGGGSGQQLNKILRLFKLIKLLRVLRAKRVMAAFDTLPIADSPLMRLPAMLIVLSYYVHFAACMLLFAEGPPPSGFGFDAPADQYMWSFARVVALTLGSVASYAADLDDAAHDMPTTCMVRTILLVMGMLMHGYVLGTMFLVMLDLRGAGSEWRKQRMGIKSTLTDKHVPTRLRRRVLEHFDQHWEAKGDTEQWRRLLEGTSQRLRTDLLVFTERQLLATPLFEQICGTSGGRRALVLKMLEGMSVTVAAPSDVIVMAGFIPLGLSAGRC
jgi:hypothetical protein